MAVPWLLIAVLGVAAKEVSCQPETNFAEPPPLPETGVGLFQGLRNRTIPNYAMVAARDFASRDGGAGPILTGLLDGLNDGLWCQSANGGENIGSWNSPDGSDVPDDLNAEPIHMAHRPGQVGLLRDGSIGSSPFQGMYTCTIPDENGITQALALWVGGNGAYDGSNGISPNPEISSTVSFQLMTALDADPPEFALSFNVSVAPPTYVACTPVDVAELSRDVTSGEYQPPSTASPVTNVTVTLRTRQAGSYQCTVSVYRVSGTDLNIATTSPINISVTDPPTNVSGVRTGLNTVQLSWSSPVSSTTPVTGYEVFYAVLGGDGITSGGTTSDTVLNITLSTLNVTYDFFVVAFSDAPNTLPSPYSHISTFIQSGTASVPSSDTPSTATTDGITTPLSAESSDIPVIVGVIVAVIIVVVILIITIVLVILWRYQSKLNLINKEQHSVEFSKLPKKEVKCGARESGLQAHLDTKKQSIQGMSCSLQENFSVAVTVALDGHKLTLPDDQTYSNVDDTQGQMFIFSSNPAYGTVTEHSKQPTSPQDDLIYSIVDNDQQEAVIVSGNPAYVTSRRAVAGAK